MGILNAVGHFIPQVQNEQVDADAYGLSDGLNDILCGLVVNIEVPCEKVLTRKGFFKNLIHAGFSIFETRAHVGIQKALSNDGASLHQRFTGGEDVIEIPFNKVEIVQFRQLPQPLTLEELPYRACCVDLLFRPGVT